MENGKSQGMIFQALLLLNGKVDEWEMLGNKEHLFTELKSPLKYFCYFNWMLGQMRGNLQRSGFLYGAIVRY